MSMFFEPIHQTLDNYAILSAFFGAVALFGTIMLVARWKR